MSGDLVRQEIFASGNAGGRQGLNTWDWDGRNGSGAAVAST